MFNECSLFSHFAFQKTKGLFLMDYLLIYSRFIEDHWTEHFTYTFQLCDSPLRAVQALILQSWDYNHWQN